MDKEVFLKALRLVKEKGPSNHYLGICGNVLLHIRYMCSDIYGVAIVDFVDELAASWPKCKAKGFPIEGDIDLHYTPGKWEGERGKLRYELIDHMIKELTK